MGSDASLFAQPVPPDLRGIWRIPTNHLQRNHALPQIYERPPVLVFLITANEIFVPLHTTFASSHTPLDSSSSPHSPTMSLFRPASSLSSPDKISASPRKITPLLETDTSGSPSTSPARSSIAFAAESPDQGRRNTQSSAHHNHHHHHHSHNHNHQNSNHHQTNHSHNHTHNRHAPPLNMGAVLSASPDSQIVECRYQLLRLQSPPQLMWRLSIHLQHVGWVALVDVRHGVCEYFHHGVLWIYERSPLPPSLQISTLSDVHLDAQPNTSTREPSSPQSRRRNPAGNSQLESIPNSHVSILAILEARIMDKYEEKERLKLSLDEQKASCGCFS
eukprot:TRINITY_DN1868_c0_g2_i1.p1 TRINITY_DN1868_c0_g2~~TRINITY_DN1868_c0_g2_i1.p1  ORF type:complete len:332 (+),score=57.02 TRINITY_DN1868_c0_g2_i1:34-1029(+)